MSLLSRLAVQAARAYGILSSRSNNISADFLVVAGGGSGGYNGNAYYKGGGGGAGGLRTSAGTSGGGSSAESPLTLSTLNTYSIVIGAGGTVSSTTGTSGSNSSISGTGISTITSTGGGYGGGASTSNNGASGGSGGGSNASSYSINQTVSGGSGTTNQGYAGGTSYLTSNTTISYNSGSGGGGAGSVGGNGVNNTTGNGGNGGAGIASSISGSSVTYAGGGGGGGYTTGGTASGGGGSGGSGTVGTAGTANTGGGGGGSSGGSTATTNTGGSGIVIISYTSASPKFVGGTLTTSGGNQIHTFTSSGTLSPITPITASYLVVAGGGGGGTGTSGGQGGGGAGGLLTNSTTLYSGATYVVTVGAGGTQGVSGSNSIVSGTGLTTLTATGGGYGANGSFVAGASGGSGGGGSEGNNPSDGGNGGAGTSGQGSNGGKGAGGAGGGGGGAGAVGANAAGSGGAGVVPGNGGIGVQSSISGTATYYAGGGGGSGYGPYTGSSTGTGGNGGGGTGASGQNGSLATPGTSNTGGGGGAKNTAGTGSASGGSGIVIISYAGSQAFNGGLVTSSGGNTIHTFTSTGALTPLTNNLNNSLRFRRSNSAYLNRTPSVAGNRQKFTFSAWIKRGTFGVDQKIFSAYSADSDSGNFDVRFSSADVLYVGNWNTGLTTTAVFRDPSAWYHVVIAVDTTQATGANRVKAYVNGNQYTLNGTAFDQNITTPWNNNVTQNIGRNARASDTYFDGYMADIYNIDGEALEPYYFGNNDANGVWKPIAYKGTYGTNGFYLTFGNTTSTTTLGYDSSPNGNNWTTNNISLTAGTTYDAMTDVPTNTSATVANYAVLNPLWKSSVIILSGANLNVTSSGSGGAAISNIDMSSGKYYCEATINTGSDATIIGIVNSVFNPTTAGLTSANTVSYYGNNGDKFVNGSQSSYGASYTTGDIIGIALDVDAGTVTFYKNNTSQGAITHGLTGPFYFATGDASSGSNIDQSWNFGQRPFSYTPPTGFVALNTFNLPTPTILQGSNNFGILTYTGNGSTSATRVDTSAVNFTPDFVWIKERSGTAYHNLFDVNRIVSGDYKRLYSNDTNAEESSTYLGTTNLNGFVNGGFTTGSGGNTNTNAATYVAWQWKANGAPSSNTSGSITSSVSVNATAGFSVVTYTGTGSNATIGHGLGVAPSWVIVKSRTTAENWMVYHISTGATKYIYLDSTGAAVTLSTIWNNTTPTSSVFSVGTNVTVNQSSTNYVAYCFAAIPGFSAFGSYTGNGSADGPFVYLGFRPRYIIVRKTDTGNNWVIEDSSRSPFNVVDDYLAADDPQAESTNSQVNIDFLSNGFKLRSAFDIVNAGSYIYMAFAENPFKNSNAR